MALEYLGEGILVEKTNLDSFGGAWTWNCQRNYKYFQTLIGYAIFTT